MYLRISGKMGNGEHSPQCGLCNYRIHPLPFSTLLCPQHLLVRLFFREVFTACFIETDYSLFQDPITVQTSIPTFLSCVHVCIPKQLSWFFWEENGLINLGSLMYPAQPGTPQTLSKLSSSEIKLVLFQLHPRYTSKAKHFTSFALAITLRKEIKYSLCLCDDVKLTVMEDSAET